MLRLACILAAVLLAGPATAACTGDCDGDGQVRINELVAAVGIALGQTAVGRCTAVDVNGDGQVTIAELIAATNALLSGCPLAATPTETPSPSPTAMLNQPPTLPSPFVYRGYVGQPIARPIGAVDPEGGAVTCAGDPLLAGMTLDPDNVLRWTPAADQLGPLSVPVQCQDDAQPPMAVAGTVAFRIAPDDSCATPVCDPATGCTATVAPVDHACCDGSALPRLPESEVFCPSGRLLQIGRNVSGFGRLQSCDHLRFLQSAQTSASLRLHIRVSCLNPLNRVTVHVKLESATRGLLIDPQSALANVFLPSQPTNGFYERRAITFPFSQDGPFLNIEETEANLTVTVRDSDGAEVSDTERVILTSDALLPDLPDP
ncbi:MAG TPA: hypothetical protein VL049_30340 [Candidatus Dormibacteraeota bacterium]|nr:hypothetical protein [Candidatus Dormibacteraeota bacterium]